MLVCLFLSSAETLHNVLHHHLITAELFIGVFSGECQTCEDEITSTVMFHDSMFYKRKAHASDVEEENQAVEYVSVSMRR
ncbi:hypothetical protein cypCar_00045240 [Cyprinus carpio]|nr:hypothetical protein cypCar_00045240 [Cyprinus carpio]